MQSWAATVFLGAVVVGVCGGCATASADPEVADSVVVEGLRDAQASESASPPSSAPPDQGTPLDCSNVLDVAWPEEAPLPVAEGWTGPSCTDRGSAVAVTWVLDSENAELADVMFVKILSSFRKVGWEVSEPSAGEGSVVRAEATNGTRRAAMRYVTFSDGENTDAAEARADASVSVSFDR